MEFTDIRLTISEAAKVFGVSSKTIRRSIKEQEISYILVRGRYKLSFKSLLDWSQKTTSRQNKLANQGIGQFVEQWGVKNKKFSPHPKNVEKMVNNS